MTKVHAMFHLVSAPQCVTNAEGRPYRFQEVVLKGTGENDGEWFHARIIGEDIERIGAKLEPLPVTQRGNPQGEFVVSLKHNYSVAEREDRPCYYSRIRILDVEPLQEEQCENVRM